MHGPPTIYIRCCTFNCSLIRLGLLLGEMSVSKQHLCCKYFSRFLSILGFVDLHGVELIPCHQHSSPSWSDVGPYSAGCLSSTLTQKTHLSSVLLSDSLLSFFILSSLVYITVRNISRAVFACHALPQREACLYDRVLGRQPK